VRLVLLLGGGRSHLVDPRTVNGMACNAGRSGRAKAARRIVEASGPTCGRCQAMLRQGTHPNLSAEGR